MSIPGTTRKPIPRHVPLQRGTPPGRRTRPKRNYAKRLGTAKPRVGSKRALRRALDAEVSRTVRERHPACVLCGERDPQKLTNGHLFKRTREATRFDTHEGGNCSTLCKSCNGRDNEAHEPYVRWYKGRYGVAAYEALEARARSGRTFETFELEEMLEAVRLEREKVA